MVMVAVFDSGTIDSCLLLNYGGDLPLLSGWSLEQEMTTNLHKTVKEVTYLHCVKNKKQVSAKGTLLSE